MLNRLHFASLRWPALLLVATVMLSGCDWPMLGFNAAHTGFNKAENTINAGNVGTLATKFVAPHGGVYGGSSLAVVNGIVYAGTDDGVYAFDAQGTTGCSGTPNTCAPLWTGAHGPALEEGNAPAVANGVVFYSAQGGNDLQAFDAKGVTGCSGTPKVCTPLWTATMNGGSAPTVANGIVYIVGSSLQAYDANGVTNCSGTPKVCTPLWTAPGGAREGAPAVANGIVYTGGNDTNLSAFDANGVTGCSGTPKVCSPLWTAAVDPTGTPAVANGIVYTNTQFDGLSAFNATTGAPLWHTGLACTYCESSPAIANGIVYVGGGSTKKIYGYDANTGVQKWSATTGDILRSTPSVANGVVYLATNDWNVYAFNANTGAQLWKFKTDGNMWSSPAIVNGVAYASSISTLYSFGLP